MLQVEGGYFKVSIELQEALCGIRIPGECTQVLNVIIRKTYGWHKEEDSIALSQFVLLTGIDKSNIIRAIKKLEAMNLIIVKEDNGSGNTYCINKEYSKWRPLSKKTIIVVKEDNPSLSKKTHTIHTTTKHKKDNTPTVATAPVDASEDGENLKRTSANEIAKRVVIYLNEVAGKKYGLVESTLGLIRARVKEGYGEKELMAVVDVKCKDPWFLKDNKKYLRPKTLFNATNFQGYLQEVPVYKPVVMEELKFKDYYADVPQIK